jgi:hypothetical protein
MSIFRIDVKERLENPLDEVIEPEIGLEFGIFGFRRRFFRRRRT